MCSKVTHHHTINAWLYYLVIFIINYNTYFRLMPFYDIHISQCNVAACLRRGQIFKHGFLANLLLSPKVKKVWKSANIWWSYGQEFGVLFFLTHSVYSAKIKKWIRGILCLELPARGNGNRQFWHPGLWVILMDSLQIDLPNMPLRECRC